MTRITTLSYVKHATAITAAAMLGVIAVVVPTPQASIKYSESLVPLIRNAIEQGSFGRDLVQLFVAGLLVGTYRGLPAALLGLSTMAFFPLLAFIEILIYPNSHNLIPFELAIYLVKAFPAIGGAYCSRWLLDRLHKEHP